MSQIPPIRPRAHLLDIHRVSERHDGREGFVRLDRNERASPIPATVFKDMLAHLKVDDLMYYPDAGPFVSRLARELGFPMDHIAETAGSDAALRRVFMAFLRPGGIVVSMNPSYAMYGLYARIFQGVPRQIDYDPDR